MNNRHGVVIVLYKVLPYAISYCGLNVMPDITGVIGLLPSVKEVNLKEMGEIYQYRAIANETKTMHKTHETHCIKKSKKNIDVLIYALEHQTSFPY